MNLSKIATFSFAFAMAAIVVTIIVLISILVSNKPPEFKPIENSRFGEIEIFGNANKNGPLVIYVSESGFLKNSSLLNGVIQKGGLVAHVNLDSYLKNSKDENMDRTTPCYEYAGELKRLSHVLQKDLKMANIDKTILITHGNKASTLGFLINEYLKEDLYFSFSIFDGDMIEESSITCSDSLINKTAKDKLSISKLSSSKSKDSLNNWIYLNKKNATQTLNSSYEVNSKFLDCRVGDCPLFDRFVPNDKIAVAAIPAVESFPDEVTSDFYVIFLSGDGGFTSFEKTITTNLNNNGIPVVGINSLKYFWRKKTPDRIANDMLGLMNTYNKKLQREKVVFVGFTLGANVIPFIASRNLKTNFIVYQALLNPKTYSEFEVNFRDWKFGSSKINAASVVDEIAKTQSIPTLCLMGEEEKNSLCEAKLHELVEVRKVPGLNYLNKDANTTSSILLEIFKKFSE